MLASDAVCRPGHSRARAVGRSGSVVCVWVSHSYVSDDRVGGLVELDGFDDGGVIDSQQPFCIYLRACRFPCKTGPIAQSGIVGGNGFYQVK